MFLFLGYGRRLLASLLLVCTLSAGPWAFVRSANAQAAGPMTLPIWVTNNTANPLYVDGVRGSDVVLDGSAVVPAHSVDIHVATFTGPVVYGDNYDWIYLRDGGTGAEYQLYVEAHIIAVFGYGDYAFFGYRDDGSSESNKNPLPFPDGYASAQLFSSVDTKPAGAPLNLALYTLDQTPPPAPVHADSPPSAATGSPNLYFVRQDNHHLIQFAPGTAARPDWRPFDISSAASGASTVTGRPAVSTDSAGLTQAFVRGTDGQLMDLYSHASSAPATWSIIRVAESWGALDGDPVREPTSGWVYAIGANHHLISTYLSATLPRYGYQDLTQQITAQPLVQGTPALLSINQSVQVFAHGTNGHLVQFSSADPISQPWSAFDITGTTNSPLLDGDPVSAAQVLFAIGANHHLLLYTWAPGTNWSMTDITAIGPYNLQFVGTPAVTVGTDNSVLVFARGTDNHLYVEDHPASTSWQTWQADDLSRHFTNATLTSNPTATADSVYALGTHNDLLDFHYTSAGWAVYNLTEAPTMESLSLLAAAPAQDSGSTDLRGVDMNHTGSGRTEVHVLSEASGYQQFADHVATPLEATTPDKWAFAWAFNGDLFGVAMNNTGSGMTEVHVLSAASNFQQFILHTATTLAPTSPTDWTFDVTPNRDLAAVHMRNTPSGQVEVHVFTAASSYRDESQRYVTGLHAVDPNQWEFRLLPSGDLVGINLNGTGSGRTEVHILSAASQYQQFTVHAATALEATMHAGWEFQVAHNGDLLAIKMNNTGSGRTEVHTLSAASNYQTFTLHAATGLASSLPGTWNFGVGSLIAAAS